MNIPNFEKISQRQRLKIIKDKRVELKIKNKRDLNLQKRNDGKG